MTEEKAVGKNISMYPSDWQTVAQVANQMDINTSLSTRLIIRDWKRMKAGGQSSLHLDDPPAAEGQQKTPDQVRKHQRPG